MNFSEDLSEDCYKKAFHEMYYCSFGTTNITCNRGNLSVTEVESDREVISVLFEVETGSGPLLNGTTSSDPNIDKDLSACLLCR